MSIAQLISTDLGLPTGRVEEIALHAESRYQHFMVGGRRIDAPTPELKLVQTWIADFLKAECSDLPEYVTAYEAGASIVRNAELHAEDKHFLSMDIKGFFRSCNAQMVERVFAGVVISHRADKTSLRVDERSARLLQRLSCYRGSLPMGAPSSPFLANRVMLPIDHRIEEMLPLDHHYSRYSDDICISSKRWMAVDRIVEEVGGVLRDYGFELNPKKTKCFGRGSCCRVTGVVISQNGSLSIGRDRKTRLKSELYRLLTKASDSGINPSVLLGELNYCKQINPEYFNRLLAKYSGCGIAVRFGGVIPAIYSLASSQTA